MNPWKILAARWNGAAFDDGFNEAAHKRAENGQFGSGASTKTKISAGALK